MGKITKSLMMMGFNTNFRKLIEACITITSFLVLVEGSSAAAGIFMAKHGLRKDIIIIAVLKILKRYLNQAVLEGEIELYINGGATAESYLAYADDLLLFSRASIKLFKNLKVILDDFSKFFRSTD